MRGYSCWKPNSNPGLESFSGALNTGITTITLNRTASDPMAGWHLVGNPYPSSIDLLTGINWDQFEPTAWFWDPGANNYVVFSTLGGGMHSQYVPPEQGFFVHINDSYTGDNTLTFTNSSRVHSTIDFLKSSYTNFLLMKVQGYVNKYSDMISVHFLPDATSGYDPGYDAYKLWGLNEAPQLYTRIGDTNVTCHSLPFDKKNMVVPMSFLCELNGEYTLKADSIETFASNIAISLEDLKLSTTQDLRLYPTYTFTYNKLDNPNRFLLHFYNPTFGIAEKNIDHAVQIYSYEDHLYIKSLNGDPLKGTVILFDQIGKDLFHGTLSNQILNIFSPDVVEGYYIVRVVTGVGIYHGKVYLK
jgi:hypothetical protein